MAQVKTNQSRHTQKTYLITDSSLSPHLSALLLILGLLPGRQQLLDAMLLEPQVEPVKKLFSILIGLSLEFYMEATRKMTLG